MFATLLRSVLGAYLVNNYLGQSNNFLTFHSTSRLLVFAGIIPTFISSFLSIIALSFSGYIENDSQLINFAMWWFGDCVGIFIVLPFMLLLFKKPRKIWNPRLFKTAIPVIISLALLMLVANQLKNLEYKRLMTILEGKIELLNNEVLAIYSDRNPVQEWLPKEKSIEELNHIFITTSNDISLIKELDDVHYLVYSMHGKQEVLLFESNNSSTSTQWSRTKILDFSNHTWKIKAFGTSQFYYNNASWMVWWFLSIGFLFISLIGAGLLVITGNNIIVKQKVEKRIKEINTLNTILKTSEARYKQLVEIQPVIFWKHLAGDKTLEFLSKEAIAVFGYPMQVLLDFDSIIEKIIHKADRKRIVKEYFDGIKSRKRFELKYRAVSQAGKQMWFKDYISSTKVNGQIEVLANDIELSQNRQKDFYIDLDSRLRRIENPDGASDTTVSDTNSSAVEGGESPAGNTVATDDENSDYQEAFGMFKIGRFKGAISKFKSFIKNYPTSKLVPSSRYWIGNSYYAMRDFKRAIDAQKELVRDFPDSAKAPDAMLNIASCQKEINHITAAKKTLNELIAKYPISDAAEKAKLRLAN